MKVAHLSDLHLLALEGAVPFRLLNKRLTGYLNLRFRRKSVHKAFAVELAAQTIRTLDVDHVVITGDVSNLALEAEFALVRRVLEDELGLSPDKVSLVPGNHDAYTGGAHRTQRFAKSFEPYMTSDLPEFRLEGSAFPFVRLRGPLAIVGLSTALPRPPFVASGALGARQLEALEALLAHPEVRSRTPVLLQHHPIHNPAGKAHAMLEGLDDAALETKLLERLTRGLLLHGHLHRRIHRALSTRAGRVDAVGATSASLLHDTDERMAGFNLYEFNPKGELETVRSARLVPADRTFREVSVPRA